MGRKELMMRFPATAKRNAALWLSQGVSPRRLALTLALGFAVGCIPVIGIPTVLCAALALGLRLNLPAIQAANYAAMPLQLILIVPFVRLGSWLLSGHAWLMSGQSTLAAQGLATQGLMSLSVKGFATHMGSMAGQALLAWVLVATPAVALITFGLTRMLRRIPALQAAEAGD